MKCEGFRSPTTKLLVLEANVQVNIEQSTLRFFNLKSRTMIDVALLNDEEDEQFVF